MTRLAQAVAAQPVLPLEVLVPSCDSRAIDSVEHVPSLDFTTRLYAAEITALLPLEEPRESVDLQILAVRRWLTRQLSLHALSPIGFVVLAASLKLLTLSQAMLYLLGYGLAAWMLSIPYVLAVEKLEQIACHQAFTKVQGEPEPLMSQSVGT